MNEMKTRDVSEIKQPEAQGFREIKPDSKINSSEAKSFWDKKFDSEKSDVTEIKNVLNEYIDDIRSKSDEADTIPEAPIDASDLKKLSPDETSAMRAEYADMRTDLKKQWEQMNDRPWPKYTEDVYITNSRGKQIKIREAGQDYDAHHIQPLSLGGKNEASNLTPLRADVHFDRRGVHKEGSPCDRLSKMLGGVE